MSVCPVRISRDARQAVTPVAGYERQEGGGVLRKSADQALNMSGGKGIQRRRRRCCCPPESVAATGEDGLALPPRVPRHTRPAGRVLPPPWLCGYPARARGAAHFPVWNRERRLDSEIPYPRAGAVSTTMAHCFLPVGDRQAREWRRNSGVSAPPRFTTGKFFV